MTFNWLTVFLTSQPPYFFLCFNVGDPKKNIFQIVESSWQNKSLRNWNFLICSKKMLTMNYCQDELQLLDTKRIHEEMLKIKTKLHFINKFHDISPGKHKRDFFLNSVLLTYFNSKPNIYVAEISNCLLKIDLFCFIWETSQKDCSVNKHFAHFHGAFFPSL